MHITLAALMEVSALAGRSPFAIPSQADYGCGYASDNGRPFLQRHTSPIK
jgi:hypothetical protein